VRKSRFWRTVVNRNQDRLGKTFVALRRHEEQVSRLTQEEWAELFTELAWVTERVQDAFAPEHFNYAFLMNLDRHVHLHVIPRYLGSRELAGATFADPEYPDSYRVPPAPSQLASREVIAAVAAAPAAPDL
jgi:diadenosine tetraphosphate (Ap4A) HIT family hydrolase